MAPPSSCPCKVPSSEFYCSFLKNFCSPPRRSSEQYPLSWRLSCEHIALPRRSAPPGGSCRPFIIHNFESFSEDPHLSGTICSAYIRGVQRGGEHRYNRQALRVRPCGHAVDVGLCANPGIRAQDQENGRMEYDSVLSPRALREIYLMPFMLAQKYAQPWVIVTSCVEGSLTRTLVMTIVRYNHVNGVRTSENAYLLRDILQERMILMLQSDSQ